MKWFPVIGLALLALAMGIVRVTAQDSPTISSCDPKQGNGGACDQSFPVIILPKGQLIMQHVMDWLKCDKLWALDLAH